MPLTVPDDFTLVTTNQFNYPLGSFQYAGRIDSVSFDVGIRGLANTADPNKVADGHPLAPQASRMHWNQDLGYIFNNLRIVTDTSIADTLLLTLGTADNLARVSLPYSATVATGSNLSIQLGIDYLAWLAGIDFAAPLPEIKAKIVSNTPNAFFVLD